MSTIIDLHIHTKYPEYKVENLIQRSSMLFFLKDQHVRIQEQIEKLIQDKELRNLVLKLERIELKIKALEGDINNNPNVNFVRMVMEKANQDDFGNKRRKPFEPLNWKNMVSRQVTLFFDEEEDVEM